MVVNFARKDQTISLQNERQVHMHEARSYHGSNSNRAEMIELKNITGFKLPNALSGLLI